MPLPSRGPVVALTHLGLSSHCICMDTFARQCLEIPKIWIRSICLLTPAARNSSAGLTAWKLEEL